MKSSPQGTAGLRPWTSWLFKASKVSLIQHDSVIYFKMPFHFMLEALIHLKNTSLFQFACQTRYFVVREYLTR